MGCTNLKADKANLPENDLRLFLMGIRRKKGEQGMEVWVNEVVDGLCRYIGQTVTVFTTSGGISGSGFTGVLFSVDCNVVRLLTDQGAPPACPVGSACTTPFGPYGGQNGVNSFCGNPFGSICVIPTRAIAAFTHNAI
jgi:hypothetical protein